MVSNSGHGEFKVLLTLDSKNLKEPPIELSDDDLGHLCATEVTEDTKEVGREIEWMWMYKHELFSWFDPTSEWHRFVIIRDSAGWYWMFEKEGKAIQIERSKSMMSVREFYRGEFRFGPILPEEEPVRCAEGHIILDIFAWIHNINKISKRNNTALGSELENFANQLFDALQHKEKEKPSRKGNSVEKITNES